MKCIVIYSPYSKKGEFEKYINKIDMMLKQKYDTVDFVKTTRKNHAQELAASACGNYSIIFVAGGDGLLSEVVSGIAEKENRPPVAIIPAGTVNDTARSLKIPFSVKGAINIALHGEEFAIDIMKINERYGVYSFATGSCSGSICDTKQIHKKQWGWFSYFFTGIKTFFAPYNIPLKIMLNDTEKQFSLFSFVLFLNSRSVSGFLLNKSAKLNDGEVDVVMLKSFGKGIFATIRNSLRVAKIFFFGIHSLKNTKYEIRRKVHSAKILNPSMSTFNLDGDYGGNSDIELSVLQSKIKIMVPKNIP